MQLRRTSLTGRMYHTGSSLGSTDTATADTLRIGQGYDSGLPLQSAPLIAPLSCFGSTVWQTPQQSLCQVPHHDCQAAARGVGKAEPDRMFPLLSNNLPPQVDHYGIE